MITLAYFGRHGLETGNEESIALPIRIDKVFLGLGQRVNQNMQ
jgi:hypothetical protein